MNSKQKINGSSWLLLALMPALLLIPAFGMAQSSRTEKSSSPMSRSLDEMVAHIETAAKGAEVIQRAAPLYVRAQSQISDGDRIAALGSIREIQSVVQNTTDTQLIRSFSRELERILSSLNSAPDFTVTTPSDLLSSTESRQVIRSFITFYQGNGRDYLKASWQRMASYKSTVKSILRQNDLPEDLAYLGIVESGYNPLALSPKRARGIWQFLPETATRFGLRQTRFVDERTDPIKSTTAAASYLKTLYAQFGDWYLALAAYNAGENRVQSAIHCSGIHNFWELSQRQLLPEETIQYVPAVLAAIAISRHPEQYGFTIAAGESTNAAPKSE